MNKKILTIVFIVSIVLFAAGCDKKEDENNKKNNNAEQSEIETNNTNNNNQNEGENNTAQKEDVDIELYSDDTKIVFKTDQGRAVYYYSGKEITAYHVYIDYGTAANANIALSVLNSEENETIESAHIEGKYLVIVYDKSTYETLNVDTLRMVYSYLEELKK